jgi:release factor glutamine methyltransferase
MEHAESQAPGARALAAGADWDGVRTADDLTGRPRALVARRAPVATRAAGADRPLLPTHRRGESPA